MSDDPDDLWESREAPVALFNVFDVVNDDVTLKNRLPTPLLGSNNDSTTTSATI